jgi:glycerol uptake facilitator-like aquaporin
MLGGIVGATLVWLMYLPHWKATKDQGAKLGVFYPGTFIQLKLPSTAKAIDTAGFKWAPENCPTA